MKQSINKILMCICESKTDGTLVCRKCGKIKPTKPMSIEECKEQIAINHGYDNWESLPALDKFTDEAMQLYASQFSENSKLDELQEFIKEGVYSISRVERKILIEKIQSLKTNQTDKTNKA